MIFSPPVAAAPVPDFLRKPVRERLEFVDADLSRCEPVSFVGLVVLHPESPGAGRDRRDQPLHPPFLSLLLLPASARLILLCTRYVGSNSDR